MKEKENTAVLEEKQKRSFKDADEFFDFLNKQRAGARLVAQEMSKHPVSLEEAIAQTRRIQQGN